jgi:hypothetical protein
MALSIVAALAFTVALSMRPSLGSSSVVPTNLTKDVASAATLSASQMLTQSETDALSIANGGRISLHDGFKTTSGIDRKHRLVVVVRVCCAQTEFFLFRASKPVILGTSEVNLAGLGIKGITVGASDAAVFRRFGKERSSVVNGNGVVQYLVPWNEHCVMKYTFDIEKHVVRGLSARDAC